MAQHIAIEGRLVCQQCLLYLPAVDLYPDEKDCCRDRHKMAEKAKKSERPNAPDYGREPSNEDYLRWNAKPEPIEKYAPWKQERAA